MTIEELIISEINKKGKIDISQFIEFCQFGKDGYYIKKVLVHNIHKLYN